MGDDRQDDLARAVVRSGRWREVERLEVTDSTNAVVAARARAGAPPGLVVVADHQTAGRGRFGRRWEDRPGGSLLVSCLVGAPPRATLVPLAVGLAVADVVARAGAEPELKWPNDVLIAGRKCAGVLVEAPAPQQWLVIGIGMNTDWRSEAAAGSPATHLTDPPGPPARLWTSLAEELGRDVDRYDILVHLLDALDRRLGVAEQNPDALLVSYRAMCATLGRDVDVETPGGPISGLATDVDERGSLLVRTDTGTAAIESGDVTHLRLMP
ncbi:MAG: biotin--[acetyl-CoA-carboxylase] ligase [Actinomycetota bacterium]|nr:biotin--[acetyl-CoA-carboxylase] ligase [Actinomycetota bacterium]